VYTIFTPALKFSHSTDLLSHHAETTIGSFCLALSIISLIILGLLLSHWILSCAQLIKWPIYKLLFTERVQVVEMIDESRSHHALPQAAGDYFHLCLPRSGLLAAPAFPHNSIKLQLTNHLVCTCIAFNMCSALARILWKLFVSCYRPLVQLFMFGLVPTVNVISMTMN